MLLAMITSSETPVRVSKMYHYMPLQWSDVVRLVQIEPDDEPAQVRCTISLHRLSDHPDYEAPS
jgi:hypothetical protein